MESLIVIPNTDKIACYIPVGHRRISESCILLYFVIFLIVSRLFSASLIFLLSCKFLCPNYCTSHTQTVWNYFLKYRNHETQHNHWVQHRYKPCTSVFLMLTVSIWALSSFCRTSDKEICLKNGGFTTRSTGIIPHR